MAKRRTPDRAFGPVCVPIITFKLYAHIRLASSSYQGPVRRTKSPVKLRDRRRKAVAKMVGATSSEGCLVSYEMR